MALCILPSTFFYYPFPKQWLRALCKKRGFFTNVLDNVNEMAFPQSRLKKWCVFNPLLFALALRHFRGFWLTLHVLVCKLKEGRTLGQLEGAFAQKIFRSVPASGGPLLACNLVTESEAPSCSQAPGSLAIHIHAFYMDTLPELLEFLGNMPFPFTLFVSVPDEQSRDAANDLIKKANLKIENVDIQITPNRGRDIAPFFAEFGGKLQKYDFIAHLHTKKSLYTGMEQSRWRQYLYKGLLGSRQRIQAILGFLASSDYGIAYPQTFADVPVFAHTWLANSAAGAQLLNRMGIPAPRGYFDFPAGTMFWARKDALQLLFDLQLTWEDFPRETGQNDGTMAHVLERVLGIVPSALGFRHAILRETENPRRTSWGMETLNCRNSPGFLTLLQSTQCRCVLFDIFDTLLTRPFLVPEDIKEVLALSAKHQGIQNFVMLRNTAESTARLRSGHDVDIDAIYAEAVQTGTLTQEQAAALQKQEIALEKMSVQARDEAVALLKQLLQKNMRVGIASDTFLPKPVMEGLLAQCGIPRPETLYVSCDCGKRKDSGEMYDYICSREKIPPHQLTMIGDNTRSDVQIPKDKDIRTFYTPGAFDLARCYPDMRDLVDEALSSPDLSHRTLTGYLIEAGCSSLDTSTIGKHTFLPSYEPYLLGKVFMAPLLLGFADWLAGKAEADGTGKLFFLARDGQIMHKVYEWRRKRTGRGPESSYLLVSRRATAVPICDCMENVKRVARTNYLRNTLELFMKERFGVAVTEDDLRELESRHLLQLPPSSDIQIVCDQDLEHIVPILEFFFPRIRQQAARERETLGHYLEEAGFDPAQNPGLVDIGYHGTMQKYLGTFFNRSLAGYYLMTCAIPEKELGSSTIKTYLMSELDSGSPYYTGSFFLEKLFAAKHGQVIRHELCQGKMATVFREEESNALKEQSLDKIHEGIFSGLERLATIEQMLGSFSISIETLRKVYLALVKEVENGHVPLDREMLLDNYYAGYGME
ncbi:MAG: HAD hydrolase-like protein [bacterium]|nr:HAD hydrolase-like protein [bacterium]